MILSKKATPKGVGAPDLNDIEITPEMIEAGLEHLYRYHPDSGVNDTDTVVAILRVFSAALNDP